MPNDKAPYSVAKALGNAFGGSPAAPAQQPSAPVAPPPGGPAAGSQPTPGYQPDGLAQFIKAHPNLDPGIAETVYKQAIVK